jgi:His/Glu/Gln/Arg/opine family amino acid ABC transporter permease subunit
MATVPEFRNLPAATPIVNYDEPPVKPPPLLAVGPLGWARRNLFGSWLDGILTLIGVTLIISVLVSVLTWATSQANWFAVTFNLRLFLLGRYETEYEWRVTVFVLFVGFTIGVCVAAFSRLTRGFFIGAVILLAILFIAPPLIEQTAPRASAYFAAGNIPIAATGDETVNPNPATAFIGSANETITLRLASGDMASEDTLRALSGFMDQASNQLRNAADTRITNTARAAELDAILAGDLLTENQRIRLTRERELLALAEPILETYQVNQVPVQIIIRRGITGEVIGETLLQADNPSLDVTLPENGWYVLETSIPEGQEGTVLLDTVGIYPLLERTVARGGGDEAVVEEGESSSGGLAVGSISQYVRMTDRLTTEETRPQDAEGDDIPMNVIVDNNYRGMRSFGEYLSLFVGPFFALIDTGILMLLVAVVAGYGIGVLLQRFGSVENPRVRIQRLALWLLGASPLVMFILVYGLGTILPLTDDRRWGGLLLTFMLTVVGIGASFPLGILLALGRRSSLPVVSTICTLYIETIRGVPLITVLYMSQLLVPLINPALADFPNVFRAMVAIIFFSAAYLAENVRGGLQSLPPGQIEAAKALGLNPVQTVLNITLPQALRAVIPALVGQFISLFKDTSLVSIVGLIEFSGAGRLIVAQTEFLGTRREVFFFQIIVYFCVCYAIAAVSRRIEASGSGATLTRKI